MPSTLKTDRPLEIDTEDILRHIGSTEPFAKGFAIVEGDVELDIVAVATGVVAESNGGNNTSAASVSDNSKDDLEK